MGHIRAHFGIKNQDVHTHFSYPQQSTMKEMEKKSCFGQVVLTIEVGAICGDRDWGAGVKH